MPFSELLHPQHCHQPPSCLPVQTIFCVETVARAAVGSMEVIALRDSGIEAGAMVEGIAAVFSGLPSLYPLQDRLGHVMHAIDGGIDILKCRLRAGAIAERKLVKEVEHARGESTERRDGNVLRTVKSTLLGLLE